MLTGILIFNWARAKRSNTSSPTDPHKLRAAKSSFIPSPETWTLRDFGGDYPLEGTSAISAIFQHLGFCKDVLWQDRSPRRRRFHHGLTCCPYGREKEWGAFIWAKVARYMDGERALDQDLCRKQMENLCWTDVAPGTQTACPYSSLFSGLQKSLT